MPESSKYEIEFEENIQVCSDQGVSKVYSICCCQLCEIKHLLENKNVSVVGKNAYVRVNNIEAFVRDYNEIMVDQIVTVNLIH